MDWTKIARKVKKELKKDKPYRDKEFKKNNGFYKEDAWNLDRATALFVLPRIAFLSANHAGSPTCKYHDDGTIEELDIDYNKILETMTEGFYLYAFKDRMEWDDKDIKLWAKTKEYFKDYFEFLWD